MAGVVAISYSEALFSLGQEMSILEVFKEQLAFVAEQMSLNQEFYRLIIHPKLHKDEKKEMLVSVFDKSLDHTFLNFLKLLVDKSRFQNLDAINKEFIKRYNKEFNIAVASVTSAKPLSLDEQNRIQMMLEKKINKKIEMRIFEDESLIAGVRIKIGDIVLDHTAKNQMNQLKVLANVSANTNE